MIFTEIVQFCLQVAIKLGMLTDCDPIIKCRQQGEIESTQGYNIPLSGNVKKYLGRITIGCKTNISVNKMLWNIGNCYSEIFKEVNV